MKRVLIPGLFMILLLSSCTFQNRNRPSRIDSNKKLQDYLVYGWNTWNNPNLLSFVKMPEGLSLQLSFRLTYRQGGPYYLDQAYISSPYQNFPEKVTPLAHAYDGSYTEMLITWKGLTARVQSATYKDNIFILYTPVELPEHPPLMILETGMIWDNKGLMEKQADFIQADLGPKTFSIGSTQEDSLVPLPLTSTYMTFNSGVQTGFYTGRKRTLDLISRFVNEKKEQMTEKMAVYGDMSDAYEAMHTLLAWNLIYDPFHHRAITPVSRVWNENWGGWVLFDWDTYFTAAMYALDNKYQAYSNAIAITNEITSEGFIPNFSAALSNGKSCDRSQPPVGSLICKMIYDKYKDKWFLNEVYDHLLTWNRWWEKARDNQGYLSWGSDPCGSGDAENTKQGAKFESGLDNSPLFDSAVFNEKTHKLELASVGLMSLYIADCKNLADIAGILGKTDDREELLSRAEKYSLKLNDLWDEKSGIYRDKFLNTGKFSYRLAPTNFYPLIAGLPTQEQAERMVNEHLLNPKEFYGEFMIPSIARDDPAFTDNDYWRGRIWAPMNFLVYLGLRNYDLPEARKILSSKSYDLIMKGWKEDRHVYENYNSVTGEGADVANSDGFYSWGGLLALIPLMESGYWDLPQE